MKQNIPILYANIFLLILTVNCTTPPGVLECDVESDCPANHYCHNGSYCVPNSGMEIPVIDTEKSKVEGNENQTETVEIDEHIQKEELSEVDYKNERLQEEMVSEKHVDEHFAELQDAGEMPEEIPKELEKVLPEEKIFPEEKIVPEKEPAKEVLPEPEIDPCEKFKALFGKPCVTGKPGICSDGTYSCANGNLICIQTNQATKETCDGKDNNCDGKIDENVPNCCNPGETRTCGNVPPHGLCKKGTQICSTNREWGNCVGLVEPKPETCDGQDNDCDGQADEDLGKSSCGIGECYIEVDNCISGRVQTCIPKQPSTEVCDGKDNDCNGQVDENLGTLTCGQGECVNSVQKCVNSVVQTCTPKPPAKEVCDGKDNDCDGIVDNVDSANLQTDINNCGKCGISCSSVGNRKAYCLDGNCCGFGVEICNNKDDDCNGLVDDNCTNTQMLIIPNRHNTSFAEDLSGNLHHVYPRNGAIIQPGGIIDGILDSKSSGYFDTKNASNLPQANEEYTIIMWASVAQAPKDNQVFVHRGTPDTLKCFTLSKKIYCACDPSGNSAVYTKNPFPTNTLFNFTHAHRQGYREIHLDGVLENTFVTGTGCSTNKGTNLTFGVYNNGSPIPSDVMPYLKIHFFAYLNKLLKTNEVKRIYKIVTAN